MFMSSTNCCAFVLSLLALWAQGSSESTLFSDVKRMMKDESYLNSLPNRLMVCLSQGETGRSETCSADQYAELTLQLLADATAKATSYSYINEEVGVDTNPYSTQFEQKISKNIAFKGYVTKSDFSAASALSTCITEFGIKLNGQSKDIPVSECSQLPKGIFEGVYMPTIASNDYLRRWKATRQPSKDDDSHSLLNYKEHWPAFLPLYDVAPVVHECPVGLHMVVWGAKSDVKVRLFDKKTASYLLKPALGSEVPHYLTYEQNGFAPVSELPVGSFTETTLSDGEFLFVPRTMLASFDTGSENNALLRSCFVDASNLKDVRAMIALEAKVADSSKAWLAEIDKLSFDYSLARNPSELPILEGSSENIPAVASAGDAEKKAGGSRRNRGGGMRDLNDISQWNTLITSLTLPIPSPPRFTNVGLKSANIEWSSYFAPSKIDKTAFGFTLSVCEVENKNICFERTYEREKLAERFSKEDADIIVFGTKLEEFLTPSQEYIARVKLNFGSSVGLISDWSHIASTKSLVPPSAVAEPVVAELRSGDRSVNKVILSFGLPDHNESPITGYNVFVREVKTEHSFVSPRKLGRYLPPKSTEGGKVSVEIEHLIPGTRYVFAVAAENALGSGPTSVLSNEVELPWLKDKVGAATLISGITNPDSLLPAASPSFPLPIIDGWNPSGRFLVTKDADQTIRLFDEEGTQRISIPTWPCHWNSHIDVSAQAAWMDPVDGASELRNSNDLLGRIAIVKRGSVPFVQKAILAQTAGALGVIIVDNGSCDKFDQSCIPGSSKVQAEGFAAADNADAWRTIRIPLYFVLQSDWEVFLQGWQFSPEAEQRLRAEAKEQNKKAVEAAEAAKKLKEL